MTQKVFALDTEPGVQRDGTVFDKQFYTDGKWVRFQRGRPRKMAGYRVIADDVNGPCRGIWIYTQNAYSLIFTGTSSGLQSLEIDDNGVGAGVNDIALSNFTSSVNNLWQFDGFKDVSGTGLSSIVAHPGQNLASIDSTVNTPVLIGDVNGSSMSQIGVFTASLNLNNNTTASLSAANPLVAAGQSISGVGIPPGTTVVSVSGTTVTMSQSATSNATVTATFNNHISVSGGVVVLHPYVFVYGNDGLIKNCSAGNSQDWVSTDSNEVNVATGKVVKGLPVRGGSNSPSGLFWSTDSVIRVSYAPQTLGVAGTPNFAAPTFWRYDIISSQSSVLSSSGIIEYDGIYYWVGVDRFLLYNGVVKEIPNAMNQNYFFDNLNYNQRQKVWATKVPRFGEIWWFYPKGDSVECNDAIVYNIRENCWYDAGSAVGARRSAGYFSQVFAFPIYADWATTTEQDVTSVSAGLVNGSDMIYLDVLNSDVAVNQVAVSTSVPSGAYVLAIQTSALKTLGAITGGSLYGNGSYTNVLLTGGSGFSARADIVVSGGAVTSVTLTTRGGGYHVGDVLSASNASLGGSGSGFSVPVTAVYLQSIRLSAAATATATETVSFKTKPNLIKIYQHEFGTDHIDGSSVTAIESYFETNDLGWVSGGPSQVAPEGVNRWLRVERVEPDFIMTGEMKLYIVGRPYAQSQDYVSEPYLFYPDTSKIDMKEQRRELRLKFESNVVGGTYQTGRIILNADVGDVRGY